MLIANQFSWLNRATAEGEKNNLNAIRLLLALGVMVSHTFPLSLGLSEGSLQEPVSRMTSKQFTLGEIAVNLFFLISGMLVTASWLRVGRMDDYLWRRVLRIFPGFVAAVVFTCLLSIALCPEFRASVLGRSWIRLLAADLVGLSDASLRHPSIFGENPFPGIANGSLWTIAKEFQCYVLVAVFGLFALFQRRILILIGTLVVWGAMAKFALGGGETTWLDRRLLTYFLFGVCVWLWRDRIPISSIAAFACLILLAVSSQWSPWLVVLFPMLGGYLTVWLAFGPAWRVFRWTDNHDLSYGVYLYAFPIQQAVAMIPGLRSPWLALLFSIPVTLVLAAGSWTLVERPFLRLKSLRPVDRDPVDPSQ